MRFSPLIFIRRAITSFPDSMIRCGYSACSRRLSVSRFSRKRHSMRPLHINDGSSFAE